MFQSIAKIVEERTKKVTTPYILTVFGETQKLSSNQQFFKARIFFVDKKEAVVDAIEIDMNTFLDSIHGLSKVYAVFEGKQEYISEDNKQEFKKVVSNLKRQLGSIERRNKRK